MNSLLHSLKNATSGQWLDPDKGFFITSGRFLIGPYDPLRNYASNLRYDEEQQALMLSHRVRFGRRDSDHLPTGIPVQGGFRKAIQGKTVSAGDYEQYRQTYDKARTYETADRPVFRERITDAFKKEAGAYFSGITLESHHIVEKSMLGDLNRNTGQLDNSIAPCVLVKGELHRRWYTPEGKTQRDSGKLSAEDLQNFYDSLYRSPEFSDLKIMARIILNNVFKTGAAIS